MVYHQGFRTRAPLYSTAFEMGIQKSKNAVVRALSPLEKAAGILNRSNKGDEGKAAATATKEHRAAFIKFVLDMFHSKGELAEFAYFFY